MPRKRKGADLSRSTSKARKLRNSRSERTEEQILQQNTDARVRMAQLHQEEPEDTRAERNEVRRLEQRLSRRFTVYRRRTNDQQRQQPPDTRPSTSTSLPKEWPINVHERPEYNPVTRRLELNGTFGDVKGKGAIKKSKMDVATVKRKATKSGTKRKKKSVPVDRVPIEKLKPLVNSTTDLLKEYFVNSKKHKDITNCQSEICTIENKLEILKNQAMLFSIVNNLDENEILKKFELLNVESEAKESN